MIWEPKQYVYSYKREKIHIKFRTVVYTVSSCKGNPVSEKNYCYDVIIDYCNIRTNVCYFIIHSLGKRKDLNNF